MEPRHSFVCSGRDSVARGLRSVEGFKKLLKEEAFADYFNTFLSLPVFAKRIFYRRSNGLFEVDALSGQRCVEFRQEDALSYTAKERGPLFLKTDICNEFRLCRKLLTELTKLKAGEEYSLDLHRELGNVLAIQRLKAFLHESAGDCIFSFWLAIERYRRQTPPECLRFVIRDIQDKFIRQGAWLELPECFKSSFKSCLDQVSNKSTCKIDVINSDLLTSCQDLAFASLTSYWVPKYLAHKRLRKLRVKQKWRLSLPSKPSGKPSMFGEVVRIQLSGIEEERKTKPEKEVRMSPFSPGITESPIKEEAEDGTLFYEVVGSLSSDSFVTQSTDIPDFESRNSSHRSVKLPPLDSKSNVIAERKSGSRLRSAQSKGRAASAAVKKGERKSGSRSKCSSAKSLSSVSSALMDYGESSSETLSRCSSSKSTSRATSSRMENGNNIALLCGKFRDATISRAMTLTDNVRGTSLHDVEANIAFPVGFDGSSLAVNSHVDKALNYLWAALSSDQLAGQPFCDYVRSLQNDEAFANVRFWTAGQQFLASSLQMDTMTRRKQARALLHIYLLEDSPRKTCITPQMQTELCEQLPKDSGIVTLNTACWECAKALMPLWENFLELDDERFATMVPHRVATVDHDVELPFTKIKYTKTFHLLRITRREQVSSTGRWNALKLAVAIAVPRAAQPLLEGYDEDEDDDIDCRDTEFGLEFGRDYEGSLQARQLRILNQQAVSALENYRKVNPYQSSMAYYYYRQNLVLNNNFSGGSIEHMQTVTRPTNERYRNTKPVLSKPKSFQEILHDPTQLEAFKKFLVKHNAEIPMYFWQAVESMRTNTKEARHRQSKTNGIVKRYFGPSTNYGRLLDCTADIVQELPHIRKVTPAMLTSAQTFVARSMEEQWFTLYLTTFPEAEDLAGITKLPDFREQAGGGPARGRSFKNRYTEFWKIFTRNIISFKRGISHKKTLKSFQNYLRLQHKLNVRRAKDLGEETQRVIISTSNKLVDTSRLLQDLRFWTEVERYEEFSDAVVLLAKIGIYTKDDEMIVTRKAKAILKCFIDSQVPPRIQINIPTDMADNIYSLVKCDIIERGLFHEAAISVFSALLHYWKKFCVYRILPREKLPACPSTAKTTRSMQIEIRRQALKGDKFRRVSVDPDDEYTKIMFSLQSGIRISVVPAAALMKTSCHPKTDPLVDHSLHDMYVTSQHK
eukprot:Seg2679.4 transcript_id=Seg2679.4/GoldUCD/mRNA.D3Y31 product="Regulator of G-protein signaling protein-like" protein_id=Seg2679.4/GoldUCD/D3Y31